MQVLLSTLWNWYRQLRTFFQLRLVRQHWLSKLPPITLNQKQFTLMATLEFYLLAQQYPIFPIAVQDNTEQPSHKSQPFSRNFHENLDIWLHTVRLHHNVFILRPINQLPFPLRQNLLV
jgi:hypothetical protein